MGKVGENEPKERAMRGETSVETSTAGVQSDATTSSSLTVPLFVMSFDDFSLARNSHIRRSKITRDLRTDGRT